MSDNQILNLISIFGGGIGDFEFEIVRLSIGTAFWLILHLFTIHVKKNKIDKTHNEDLIIFASITGLAYYLIQLLSLLVFHFIGPELPLNIFFERDLTLLPPILHCLNLIAITFVSLYFLLYFQITPNHDVKKCSRLSVLISLTFLLLSYLVCYELKLFKFCMFNFLFHITAFIILSYVLYNIIKVKNDTMRGNALIIVSILISSELLSSLDVFSNLKYTMTIAPIRNNIQNISIGFIIYFFIKAQAKDLEEQRNEFQLRSADRQIIIQGVAHELRSPLAGLLGLIEVFNNKIITLTKKNIDNCIDCPMYNECNKKEKCSNCEKTKFMNTMVLDGFKEIEDIVQRLNYMVMDLTEFGKKTRQYDIKCYDLKGLVETSVRYAKFTETSKLVTSHGIKFHVKDDCKAFSLVSPSKFLQIMQNLILNSVRAIKAKGSGDIAEIDVILKTNTESGFHIITIKDNGVGMTDEQVEHCIDKYYTTYINAGGTGLGLYFVDKYIKEFGGKMEIKSVLNEGTTINLYFPIIDSINDSPVCE